MIQYKFLLHFSIRIIISFIFFTAVGTISHELGHVSVAKYLGYKTELHYGSMGYLEAGREKDPLYIEYHKILEENIESIKNAKDFEKKDRYLELIDLIKKKYPKIKDDSHWVTLGGPAQTILTSFLGLFILFYRKSKEKKYFVLLDWLGVFLALFALREVSNFFTGMYSLLFYGTKNFNGDEFRLSRHFGMSEWIIPSFAMILGAVISLYVIFRVIPIKYRFTFIISGLVGGVAGFILWFRFLGPVLIP